MTPAAVLEGPLQQLRSCAHFATLDLPPFVPARGLQGQQLTDTLALAAFPVGRVVTQQTTSSKSKRSQRRLTRP
jgi:hypothetical protein